MKCRSTNKQLISNDLFIKFSLFKEFVYNYHSYETSEPSAKNRLCLVWMSERQKGFFSSLFVPTLLVMINKNRYTRNTDDSSKSL